MGPKPICYHGNIFSLYHLNTNVKCFSEITKVWIHDTIPVLIQSVFKQHLKINYLKTQTMAVYTQPLKTTKQFLKGGCSFCPLTPGNFMAVELYCYHWLPHQQHGTLQWTKGLLKTASCRSLWEGLGNPAAVLLLVLLQQDGDETTELSAPSQRWLPALPFRWIFQWAEAVLHAIGLDCSGKAYLAGR